MFLWATISELSTRSRDMLGEGACEGFLIDECAFLRFHTLDLWRVEDPMLNRRLNNLSISPQKLQLRLAMFKFPLDILVDS